MTGQEEQRHGSQLRRLLALEESGVWEIGGTFVWALVLIGAGLALLLEQRYTRDNR
ncbi:MAG: hypothetical protein V3T83_07610 [Acidobacteriota bacterium]